MVAHIAHLAANNPQVADMQRIFQAQRSAYALRPMPSANERIANLKRLREVVIKYQDDLADAVSQDFGHRSKDETKIAEILTSLEAIKYSSKNLTGWMKPQKRHSGLLATPAKARVVPQPLGVIGVVVPWNYPIFLALGPLVGALSAGNRVMIKTSSFTPRLGETLKRMLAEAFTEDAVSVITGRGEVSEAFSHLPFDQITFTGSTNVGRTIMANASANLTPVLLELGGKSPAIVHESFPIEDAAERIAFGKCWNAGQTCVAPDYLLMPRGKTDQFVIAFTSQVSKMYPTLLTNADFTSIVNDKQYTRIQSYLDDARAQGARVIEINPANERFENTRKIPPTIVLGATPDMLIMQNEIFGPVLPILEIESLSQALEFVNARPRPLALYYFDYDEARADYVVSHTHSGGVGINDVVTHVGVDDLPFGGVGPSGMGRYHAKEGFETYSNMKAVLERPKFYSVLFILPPFGRSVHGLIQKVFLSK
ncbi:MAG: coniferyl aldehyde dehydrogenase [Perlucidibaca sp.]